MSVSANRQQYVVFQLGSSRYGLPVAEVKETIQLTDMTELPEGSGIVKGVMNVRGSLLTVVDSGKLLGLLGGEGERCTRLLMMSSGSRLIGLAISSVPVVMSIGSDQRCVEIGGGTSALGELAQSTDGKSLIRLLDSAWILSRIDSSVPAGAGSAWSSASDRHAVAADSQPEESGREGGIFIPFRAAGADYAIDAALVRNVRSMPAVLDTPAGGLECLLGVAADRRGMVPVFHAGLMLEDPQPAAPTRIIVLELQIRGKQAVIGLAVERADRLVTVPHENFMPLPPVLQGAGMDWITGVYQRNGTMTYTLDVSGWQGWESFFSTSESAAEPIVEEARIQEEPETEEEELYVFFEIERSVYGIRAADVKEVLQEQEVTPLPDMPNQIVGLTNIRGHLVTVIDLAARLGHRDGARAPGSRMIVVQAGECRAVFPVDDVKHLRRLGHSGMRPAPGRERRITGTDASRGLAMTDWQGGRMAVLLEAGELVL